MSNWYEKSFGEDYLIVYKHRSRQDASREVARLQEWLQLQEKQLILDLCCGMGRHTIALARKGYSMVGLDLSRVLLSHAVRESEGLAIPFVHGDMRALPFVDHTFDVVLNLFTSFGYFERDEDNLRVLSEIHRVLKPQGQFVMDFLNRHAVEQNLVPESVREEDNVWIREERWIDGDFVCKKITVKDERGERRYEERVKMVEYPRLRQWMEQTGLTVVQAYGDFAGHPYTKESERMIMVGCVNK
ncbi:class I SAM-dependent methyltransferase [Laceyella putida]|jgi:SAM-dependent methyltransferase|uniref:Class I SAM-dependent methyltransferase n=1 Tax=Laceyella putida TaxID=110101 RepID=A0ABW2RFC7_9BACL